MFRLDLVGGTDPPAFRHRDADYNCSQTSGGLSGGFLARFPQTVRSGIVSHASNSGHRICTGGRCPFKRAVSPHSGVLVWGHFFRAAGSPQVGPFRPDNGETGRGLVRTCCGGTHSQVSLKNKFLPFYINIQLWTGKYSFNPLTIPLFCSLRSLRKAVEEAMDPALARITAYVSQDCTGMKYEPFVDEAGYWAGCPKWPFSFFPYHLLAAVRLWSSDMNFNCLIPNKHICSKSITSQSNLFLTSITSVVIHVCALYSCGPRGLCESNCLPVLQAWMLDTKMAN